MKKRVLVADDNKLIHELYAGCCGDDFELLHAYDGAEALCLAVDLHPDLILLDIMMPILDGRSVCRQLRRYPSTAKIKIIMVTAKDSQADRLVGFEVGADDYVEKPCTPDYLLLRVKKLLL
jgi:DNA-binding response OmpR family regulator